MSDPPYVREIGRIDTDILGVVRVGVDYDTVSLRIGDRACMLTAGQMEELAQYLVSAVWQAGQQKVRMDEEAAAKGAFDMAPGMSSGLPPRTCTCGQWPHDQHCPALDDR